MWAHLSGLHGLVGQRAVEDVDVWGAGLMAEHGVRMMPQSSSGQDNKKKGTPEMTMDKAREHMRLGPTGTT